MNQDKREKLKLSYESDGLMRDQNEDLKQDHLMTNQTADIQKEKREDSKDFFNITESSE